MTNQSNAPLQPAVLLFLASVLVFLAFGCSAKTDPVRSVLVFSKTAGFRHPSIEDGKEMFLNLAREQGFTVDTTEDAGVFTEEQLSKYNVVVFLSTTGDILDPAQQVELERFLKAGGNWMGIHAAADTEYEWPWYNKLVGGYFAGHPKGTPEADIQVLERNHPATAHLNEVWHHTDEWYNYKNLQDDIRVLMNLDETSYEGGTNGDNHPIAWYKDFEAGRMFYTGLGHTPASYRDPKFVAHVAGGLTYLFGQGKAVDYAGVTMPPDETRFPVETLVTGMTEPMELEVLPDGRPLWIQRGGEVMVYDPDFGEAAVVNKFDVWTEFEDGMLGIALDPDFSTNSWVYLYRSPNIEESVQRLSRFQWTGNKLDVDSEQIILDVPTDRNKCCHSGGSVEFGPTGLLHLSLGDNTNPFESDGFAPIDDSRDIPNFDARRSSANTQDLRGGIIRIRVEDDGSYSIPEGNLFTDPEEGRPEIYAMGMRNPFRIHVDQKNGNVYWGDVGPDAGKDSLGLGPRGHDEVNVAREAGFFGWPLFIGNNKPYHARDFKTGELGAAFDPAAPLNESQLNTGARSLPPAQPAMIYYPYAQSEEFPSLGNGGRNAMAGPVYYQDLYPEGEGRFPADYDGKFFFYDWMRDYIMVAGLDETGYVTDFEPFLPSQDLRHPMDMLFGPDGSLYIIEYGRKWFSRNIDARLLRIRYNGGNRPPVAGLVVDNLIGAAPFALGADAGAKSFDHDGDVVSYRWLLDGQEIGSSPQLAYTVDEPGVHTLTLVVDDGQGNQATQERELIVGNSVPEVTIELAGNRSFFFPGESLDYSVNVTDVEDGRLNDGIDPRAVTVTMNYLEGEDEVEIQRGHQVAGQGTAFAIGRELMIASDCESCHLEREDNIGPSYLAIAERYRPDPKAADYLAGKIITGGNGVWGEQNMSAHPDLPEGEAKQIAEYILSLAGPAPDTESAPVAGNMKLDRHQAGTPGRYYLQASYTDQGDGAKLPRLTTTDVVVLRAPRIPAHKFKTARGASAFTVPADMNPRGDGDLDVLIAADGGLVSYGDLDLTGIAAIGATVMLAPTYTSGGTIEVYQGAGAGRKLIGSYVLEQGVTTYGENELDIPLRDVRPGVLPLSFQFSAVDPTAQAGMGVVLDWTFKRGRSSK